MSGELIGKCDRLAALVAKMLDNFRCRRCVVMKGRNARVYKWRLGADGKMRVDTGLHAAHIYGRARGFATRWDVDEALPRNVISLCAECHGLFDRDKRRAGWTRQFLKSAGYTEEDLLALERASRTVWRGNVGEVHLALATKYDELYNRM